MNPIRTNIYRRTYASGREAWMVRWWDKKSDSWIAIKGGNTRDEALIAEAKVRHDLLAGQDPRGALRREKAETVAEVIDLFYQSPRFLTATPQWQAVGRLQFDGPVKEHLGKCRFSDLKRDRVLRFYLKLKEEGLSHSTIRKYHYQLCVLGDVYTERHPDRPNPFRQIKDFQKLFPRQPSTRDINFLVPEEVEALLQEIRKSSSNLLYELVELLAFTGIRRSEALALKWTDIDEKQGFLHVRKSKTNTARSVPLEAGAKRALSRLSRKTEYVLTRPDGTRPDKDSFLRPMQRAAKRAGITKRIDLHTLRHSYGSNKIRAGWGLKKVSLLLGHSDITMTAHVYAHLLDGDLKVSDEFRFDNPAARENSEKRPQNAANLDAQAILNMLQTLQNQLMVQLPQMSGASAAGVSQKNVEKGRKTRKTAEHLHREQPSCDANATCDMRIHEGLRLNGNPHDVLSLISKDFANFRMADPTGLEPVTFRSVV